MIPFTPDERRAQFAPSQNVGGPVDPDILDIIGERPQPTMAQQVEYEVPEPRPIDPDVMDIVNKSQGPMMASLMGASQVNPDQAAEAKRLGSQIGIGQDIALRNLEDVRKRAFMADVQRRDIARANPVLAGFLSDPTFANEASDDIEPLSKFERAMDYIANIGQAAIDIPGEFGAGFRTGQVLVEAGMLGSTAQLRGRATEDEIQKWNQYQAELQTLSGDVGFWRQTGETLGQLTRAGEEAVKGGVAGGVTGAGAALLAGQLGPQVFLPEEIVTVPAATLFGVGAGITSAFATTSARTMAGNNYMKNIQSGMDPDVARVTALGVGAIGGALELFGAKLVAAPFKGLWSKVVSDAANDALVQPTVAKAVANAGLQYSKAVGGEIGTEVSQQITEIAFDEIAGYASDPNFESRFATPEGRLGIREELKDIIVRTALGMSVLGGIGPGANLYVDTRRAGRAVRSQQAIQSVVESVNAANLKRRDPDALEAFGNAALRETPAFIRGDTLRGILDANEVSNAEIDAIVPGLSVKIQEAVNADNFVSIPLAQFGVRLAGTKVGDAMVPHLTVDPTAMTPAELEAFNSNVQEFTALAAAEYEAKTQSESAFVQEADQVATTMRERLIAAGRDPALAEVESLVHQAFVVTQAARQGKTPAQFEAESGLREIVGAEMPAAPLGQASRMTLADVEQAFTDLGVEQRLTETDAAIRPGIIRVPENLRAEGRATNAMQRLIEYADQVGKRIDVSPTAEFGANKRRLVEWYKRLGFVENKGRNKDFAISSTMYRVPQPVAALEQAAVPASLDVQHREAIKAGDIATSQALTDAAAENRMPDSKVRDEAGKIMRVFHGTQRIDRVGNRLLKKRATSGPMPFFTNTRPIAEGYAQGKQDTSIEDIGYEQWIKYTPKGQRSKVTLDQAWFYLTPEQKATATERLFTTGYENPDEGTGAIVGNTDTRAAVHGCPKGHGVDGTVCL